VQILFFSSSDKLYGFPFERQHV